MTIGTAIVLSVAILCVSFIVVIGIGAHLANKKQATVEAIAENILKKKNKL